MKEMSKRALFAMLTLATFSLSVLAQKDDGSGFNTAQLTPYFERINGNRFFVGAKIRDKNHSWDGYEFRVEVFRCPEGHTHYHEGIIEVRAKTRVFMAVRPEFLRFYTGAKVRHEHGTECVPCAQVAEIDPVFVIKRGRTYRLVEVKSPEDTAVAKRAVQTARKLAAWMIYLDGRNRGRDTAEKRITTLDNGEDRLPQLLVEIKTLLDNVYSPRVQSFLLAIPMEVPSYE